ncbi:hypothetical protein ACVR0O_01590 [Streptococcus caviae]|nr:hypothetical protein [Streptococcus sp. 'caviae']
MKKLFAKLFEPKQEQQAGPAWTVKNDGWEASARAYNRAHGLAENKI